MALIFLPEKFLRGEWHEFSFNQLGMRKTILNSAGVLICDSGESSYSKHIFSGHVTIAQWESHSFWVKVKKKKAKQKFLSWKWTSHIDYTFRIIQTEAKLSCSETTLFSQVIAGICRICLSFPNCLFLFVPVCQNLGFVKVNLKQRGACSLIFCGHSRVKKVPVKEKAMTPSW